MLKRLTTLSAAALLAAAPVLAQGHGHDHGKMEHGKMGEMECPHHQAATGAVDRALALLDEALAAQDEAKADQKVTQARQQLASAKQHMAQCQEMMGKMKGEKGHAGHGEMKGQGHSHGAQGAAAPAKNAQVVDPVCGMKIDPATAAATSTWQGKTYHFCSKDEKEKFDKDPAKYVKKGS